MRVAHSVYDCLVVLSTIWWIGILLNGRLSVSAHGTAPVAIDVDEGRGLGIERECV